MTAIAGFDSRATLGLRAPRSVSYNIDPDAGGVALHHGGDNVPTTDHASCRRTWAGWQRFHMDGRGWADLAYTLGVCQHGYALAGRGARVRTAANGTNVGNSHYYAVCWVGGARQAPTDAALSACRWAVGELRRAGAGDRVVGHSDLRATACPHPAQLALARRIDRQPVGGTTPPPSEEPDPMANISDDRVQLLDALAGELLDAGARPTSLVHVLNGWRAIAEATGASANDPAEVAARIVACESREQAALLRGTARQLAAVGARATSLSHVLATHRAMAEALGVPGNDPQAFARALVALGD